MAASLARLTLHCGAIVFSRTGDPAIGDFEDAVILKTVGEVDFGLGTTTGNFQNTLRTQHLTEHVLEKETCGGGAKAT
jgi:hypothetical protein